MPNNWVNAARPVRSSLSIDAEFHRTYTSHYRVISGHEAAPQAVSNPGGLPNFGSSYSWYGNVDLWAFCKGAKVQPQPVEIKYNGQRALQWDITVTHSSRPDGNSTDSGTARDNPLDDKPVISGSFTSNRVPRFRDKDGNVIENAAGQVYNPPVEVDDSYDSIRIAYNHATISLSQRAQARGCVNSAPIWGLAARQAKLVRWDWRVLRAGNSLEYIRSEFEFLINYALTPATVCVGPAGVRGWYTVLPNTGDHYYVGGDKTDPKAKRAGKDGVDESLADKIKLTCTGDRQADQGAAVGWNVFEVENEYNFTTLPSMPNPLPGPFV